MEGRTYSLERAEIYLIKLGTRTNEQNNWHVQSFEEGKEYRRGIKKLKDTLIGIDPIPLFYLSFFNEKTLTLEEITEKIEGLGVGTQEEQEAIIAHLTSGREIPMSDRMLDARSLEYLRSFEVTKGTEKAYLLRRSLHDLSS